eukprot:1368057-Rhodomonas_salina.1
MHPENTADFTLSVWDCTGQRWRRGNHQEGLTDWQREDEEDDAVLDPPDRDTLHHGPIFLLRAGRQNHEAQSVRHVFGQNEIHRWHRISKKAAQ